MNCPNCGAPLFPGEPKCRKCGAPSNWNPATTLTPIQPVQPQEPPKPVVEEKPKKPRNKVAILLIVLIVVVILATILILVFVNKSHKKENDDCKPTVEEPERPVVTEFSIAVGNFIYRIPISYATKVENDYLEIMDRAEDPTWFITLSTQEINFDSMLTLSDDEIQRMFLNKGVTTATVNKQTVNGKQYLVVNCVMEGNNVLYAYTKANAEFTFVASITTANNTFGASYLNVINTIFSSSIVDERKYGYGVNAFLPYTVFASLQQ